MGIQTNVRDGVSDIMIAIAPVRLPSTLGSTVGLTTTTKVKESEMSKEFGTW